MGDRYLSLLETVMDRMSSDHQLVGKQIKSKDTQKIHYNITGISKVNINGDLLDIVEVTDIINSIPGDMIFIIGGFDVKHPENQHAIENFDYFFEIL